MEALEEMLMITSSNVILSTLGDNTGVKDCVVDTISTSSKNRSGVFTWLALCYQNGLPAYLPFVVLCRSIFLSDPSFFLTG
jgi:hypothetical protein